MKTEEPEVCKSSSSIGVKREAVENKSDLGDMKLEETSKVQKRPAAQVDDSSGQEGPKAKQPAKRRMKPAAKIEKKVDMPQAEERREQRSTSVASRSSRETNTRTLSTCAIYGLNPSRVYKVVIKEVRTADHMQVRDHDCELSRALR